MTKRVGEPYEVKDKEANQFNLYETSSQFQRWYFTKEELSEIRTKTNLKSFKIYEKNMVLEKEARVRKNVESLNRGEGEVYEVDKMDPYLSYEEEEGLLNHYLNSVTSLFKTFDYSNEVKATAMVYIKRYFLFNSLLKDSHFDVLVACVFLAAKTENQFTTADSFLTKCRRPVSKNRLIQLEFKVAAGINFDFTILHPYLPLLGIYFELQELDIELSILQPMYEKSVNLINKTYKTDVSFLYMPSQIALATFKFVAQSTNIPFDAYLHKSLGERYGQMVEVLDKIIEDFLKLVNVAKFSKQEIRQFDLTMICARHPEKNSKNALYQPNPNQ